MCNIMFCWTSKLIAIIYFVIFQFSYLIEYNRPMSIIRRRNNIGCNDTIATRVTGRVAGGHGISIQNALDFINVLFFFKFRRLGLLFPTWDTKCPKFAPISFITLKIGSFTAICLPPKLKNSGYAPLEYVSMLEGSLLRITHQWFF